MPSMLIPTQVEEKGIEESPLSDDPPISDSKQPIIILIKMITLVKIQIEIFLRN